MTNLYFNSMAAQLTTVVEKVVKINENMDSLNDKQTAVSDVAKLWNDSYNRETEAMVEPSLSVYTLGTPTASSES